MGTIFNIRGANGSGKSWVVSSLKNSYEYRALTDDFEGKDTGKPQNYHIPEINLYIVGRYETPTGGCDGIKTQDEICRRVLSFATIGNVVFEGIIVSTIYKRYKKLSKALAKGQNSYWWMYLDTPIEICRENIAKRRALSKIKRSKPFDDKLLQEKIKSIRATRSKAMQDQLCVWYGPPEECYTKIIKTLFG